jgi:hypothetical protein
VDKIIITGDNTVYRRYWKNPYPYNNKGEDSYLTKLHRQTYYCEQALAPVRTLGRVSAIRVRNAEHDAFKYVSALTDRQSQHIRQCAQCHAAYKRLTQLWAECNLWLVEHNTPTVRSKSDEVFQREISDRRYRKLKTLLEETLHRQELDERIESKGSTITYDELFSQCLPSAK